MNQVGPEFYYFFTPPSLLRSHVQIQSFVKSRKRKFLFLIYVYLYAVELVQREQVHELQADYDNGNDMETDALPPHWYGHNHECPGQFPVAMPQGMRFDLRHQ